MDRALMQLESDLHFEFSIKAYFIYIWFDVIKY